MKPIEKRYSEVREIKGCNHSAGRAEWSICRQVFHTLLRKATTVVLATITILCVLFFSCEKYEPEQETITSMEDYFLDGSGCSWNLTNLTEDSVYVINSQTELLSLITGSNPPSIDFEKKTLLFICGNTNVFEITKDFRHLAENEYELNVELILDDTINPHTWCLAMVVPKLSTKDIVTLNLVRFLCEDTIYFTNYPLEWSQSYWNLTKDSLYIINSNAELLTLFGTPPSNIDFKSHTLLYLRSNAPTPPITIDVVFLKNYCTSQYDLNLCLELSPFQIIQRWYISILVPKITNSENIILNVQYIY